MDLDCSPSAHAEPRSSPFFPMVPSGMTTANRLPSSKPILSMRASHSNYLHALCHYLLISPLLFLEAHCVEVPSSYSYFHCPSSGHVWIISSWPLWLYLPGKRSLLLFLILVGQHSHLRYCLWLHLLSFLQALCVQTLSDHLSLASEISNEHSSSLHCALLGHFQQTHKFYGLLDSWTCKPCTAASL